MAPSSPPRHRFILLLVITCIVTWTSSERYMDPVGEKYVPTMAPGAADFFVTFAATKALLMGENPYHHSVEDLMDPWERPMTAGSSVYRIAYPPSHFLLYLPFAMITRDTREAGRLLFGVNLLALLGLAAITYRLITGIKRATDFEWSPLLIPLFFVILSANAGTSLALERGQSDILLATMCWGAILLFVMGQRFLVMVLIGGAAAMKGYAALVWIGLFVLSLRPGAWRSAIAGTLTSLAIFVLPVIQYLRDGLSAVLWRSEFSATWWANHSFWNVFGHVSPALAEPGRVAMVVVCLTVAVACWWHARLAASRAARNDEAFWVVLFASTALMAVLGWSRTSFVYNLVMVLPGILIAWMTDKLWDGPARGIPPVVQALEVVVAVGLFKFQLGSSDMPLAGLAIILFVGMVAGAMVWHWRELSRPARQQELDVG